MEETRPGTTILDGFPQSPDSAGSRQTSEERIQNPCNAFVSQDMEQIICYWERRKECIVRGAAREFLMFVEPAFLFNMEPFINQSAFNALFMEWLLFESTCANGLTPVEIYARNPPASASAEHRNRVKQLVTTQFFSRFIIQKKDRESGMTCLEDIRTGKRYQVFDANLCQQERWTTGTVAERIACMDGVWQSVANVHLYDRASHRQAMADKLESSRSEGLYDESEAKHASLYLQLVRDLIGIDGRYRNTARIVSNGEREGDAS